MISLVLVQENAIILAATEKFVELGQEAAVRVIGGMTCEKQDAKAEQILQLLTAYRRKDRLSDDNLESLLLALKKLSGGNNFPTVDPIVGQDITYRVTGITDGGGGDSGGGSGDPRPTFDAYDPTSGAQPTAGSGTSGAIKKGDQFYATKVGAGYGDAIGIVFGVAIYFGCIFTAKIPEAGNNRDDWYLSQEGF